MYLYTLKDFKGNLGAKAFGSRQTKIKWVGKPGEICCGTISKYVSVWAKRRVCTVKTDFIHQNMFHWFIN